VRVTACIDCATTILGERLRCPRCHEEHARSVIATPVGPPITAPTLMSRGLLGALIAWLVLVEVVTTIVLVAIVTLKGCW